MEIYSHLVYIFNTPPGFSKKTPTIVERTAKKVGEQWTDSKNYRVRRLKRHATRIAGNEDGGNEDDKRQYRQAMTASVDEDDGRRDCQMERAAGDMNAT